MVGQDMAATKGKILKTAAKMFSERGYDRVTMREIAKTVGINPASIYYHFASKADILKSLFRLYTEYQRAENPDLGELLRLAEVEPPHAVLAKAAYHFQEEAREMLDQILVTASREINSDLESEQFIRESIFDNIANILRPLLRRMVELGKIEPFDDETFFRVLSYYCYSAAALNNSAFRQNGAEYLAGMSYIFSTIVPAGPRERIHAIGGEECS